MMLDLAPTERIGDGFKHFFRCTLPALAPKFFDHIAIGAKDLEVIHPTFCLQALVYGSAGYTITTTDAQFSPMLSAVIIDMVEAQRIEVGIETADIAAPLTA